MHGDGRKMEDWGAALDRCIDVMSDDLRVIRRHLHAHPERSRQEFRTVDFLASKLEHEGIPLRLIPSRRGIVAEPPGEEFSHRVAFRADIDALPIQDLKEVCYRSTHEGVMHACGHDAHAT